MTQKLLGHSVYVDAADVDDNNDDDDNNNNDKQYHLDGGETMCPPTAISVISGE